MTQFNKKRLAKDFAARTLQNLNISPVTYETTHLINSFLGLVIIPWEHLREELERHHMSRNQMQAAGWPTHKIAVWKQKRTHTQRTYINFSPNDPTGLSEFIRHLRNSIGHGRISTLARNGEITALRMTDKESKKQPYNFDATFTLAQLAVIIAKWPAPRKLYHRMS